MGGSRTGIGAVAGAGDMVGRIVVVEVTFETDRDGWYLKQWVESWRMGSRVESFACGWSHGGNTTNGSVLTAPDLAVPPICHRPCLLPSLFFREVSKSGFRVGPMRVPCASCDSRKTGIPPSNVRYDRDRVDRNEHHSLRGAGGQPCGRIANRFRVIERTKSRS